jgi:hypothetical protein
MLVIVLVLTLVVNGLIFYRYQHNIESALTESALTIPVLATSESSDEAVASDTEPAAQVGSREGDRRRSPAAPGAERKGTLTAAWGSTLASATQKNSNPGSQRPPLAPRGALTLGLVNPSALSPTAGRSVPVPSASPQEQASGTSAPTVQGPGPAPDSQMPVYQEPVGAAPAPPTYQPPVTRAGPVPDWSPPPLSHPSEQAQPTPSPGPAPDLGPPPLPHPGEQVQPTPPSEQQPEEKDPKPSNKNDDGKNRNK